MNIAAKTAFWTNQLKIPYVKDGIVAWWDGVWNTGKAVHSGSLYAWVDCIGGLSVQLTSADYVSGKGVFISNANHQVSKALDIGQECHIEVAARWEQSSLTHDGPVFCVPACGQFAWDARHSGVCVKFRQNSSSSIYHYDWPSIGGYSSAQLLQSKVMHVASVFCSPISSNRQFFFNGVKYALPANSWEGNAYDSSKVPSIGSPSVKSTVFCIRVYNRALTAAEISTNYALDRIRFSKA